MNPMPMRPILLVLLISVVGCSTRERPRTALLEAANRVMGVLVSDVLIIDIVRQDS